MDAGVQEERKRGAGDTNVCTLATVDPDVPYWMEMGPHDPVAGPLTNGACKSLSVRLQSRDEGNAVNVWCRISQSCL